MRKFYINTAVISFLLFLPIIAGAQSLNPLNAHLQAVRIGLVDEFFDKIGRAHV